MGAGVAAGARALTASSCARAACSCASCDREHTSRTERASAALRGPPAHPCLLRLELRLQPRLQLGLALLHHLDFLLQLFERLYQLEVLRVRLPAGKRGYSVTATVPGEKRLALT
jgi:hypothetical protein